MRELRQNASAVLRRVAAGESFVVTDRGRPVARLIPFVGSGGIAALVEAGQASLPRLPMSQAPPAVTTEPGQPSAAEALEALRADER